MPKPANINLPEDRVALITGGARGLGFAVAERLGRDGLTVVLGDVEVDAAHSSGVKLTEQGIKADGLALDVTDESSAADAVRQIERRFGRLDVLVNNAGILPVHEGRISDVSSLPLQLWQRTIDVNLTGPFIMSKVASPLIRESPAGRIVMISSRAARMRAAGNAHYSASKAGLVGLARVLAGELGPHGTTVNCIAPSRIDTELNRDLLDNARMLEKAVLDSPVGRLCTPEDIAAAAAYLVSHDAGFVNGAIIDVTGGSFMP